MSIATNQLLDAAVRKGLVDKDTVDKLQVEARRNREDILDMVTSHGQFPRSSLYQAYAETRNLPFIDLSDVDPVAEYVNKLPESLMLRRSVLPIKKDMHEIIVASADPDDRTTLAMLNKLLHHPVKIVLAEPVSLQRLIGQTLIKAKKQHDFPVDQSNENTDSEATMDKILKEAFLRRASDVHIEPLDNEMRVRLRVDGILQIINMGLNLNDGLSLISRIKVLSGLDIAEQRLPQDGGFTHEVAQHIKRKIDIRVATAPTRWGERATLRLLGMETSELTLEHLGMAEDDLKQFDKLIRNPYGVVLLTGPTGSGKTTTLYGALRKINRPSINIMTIEDPIEYVISGVNQYQVGSSTKSTFGSALRSLLRHDPDVLMVGEIRDYETADVALKASLTGHLVFTTLHTNSACSAITRLVDIGCERYLIGSSLTAVIAQRLVRRLCSHCKKPYVPSSHEAGLLKQKERNIYKAEGCVHCLGTGYRGRIGLYECLWLDEEIRDFISRSGSEKELSDHARKKGLRILREDGYRKVLDGSTSMEEVLAVTVADH